MEKKIEYFDAKGKSVPEARAVIYIERTLDDSGKVIREQVGFTEKRTGDNKLAEAFRTLRGV